LQDIKYLYFTQWYADTSLANAGREAR